MEKQIFNLESFDIKLDTEFIGRNFIYAEEVNSTNTVLLNDRKSFSENGTVLLAEFQREGRGRKQRKWYSPHYMNLTFSILLTNQAFLSKKINLVNLAASLAVSTAIENLFQLRTELKWPNDILINSKKVSGILLESFSKGSNIKRLVVGIGINVNQGSFQGEFEIEPTSIRNELGEKVEREKVLAEVLNVYEGLLEKVKSEPVYILKNWRSRCRMIGEKVTIVDDGSSRHGVFDDIDNNGFLILKTDTGKEIIKFGDVSLR